MDNNSMSLQPSNGRDGHRSHTDRLESAVLGEQPVKILLESFGAFCEKGLSFGWPASRSRLEGQLQCIQHKVIALSVINFTASTRGFVASMTLEAQPKKLK
jgi:hypothetical protein